ASCWRKLRMIQSFFHTQDCLAHFPTIGRSYFCKRRFSLEHVTDLRQLGTNGLSHVRRFFFKNSFDRNSGLLHVTSHSGGVHVERIIRRQESDQRQQDQSDSLLAIVGSVCEADSSAGHHEDSANPAWRVVTIARRVIELGVSENTLHDE